MGVWQKLGAQDHTHNLIINPVSNVVWVKNHNVIYFDDYFHTLLVVEFILDTSPKWYSIEGVIIYSEHNLKT